MFNKTMDLSSPLKLGDEGNSIVTNERTTQENPLQKVVLEYINKRQSYNRKDKSVSSFTTKINEANNEIDVLDGSEEEKTPLANDEVDGFQEILDKKPTIELFLSEFNEKVKQVNLTYKLSK
jgi:hypothetical protein